MSNLRAVDDIASASYIASGKELVSQERFSLLLNRVINIKFQRKFPVNGKDTFTIRSDYEPVFHKDGSVSFVPCTVKPSINLKYNQVSGDTAIKVTIEIDSLYFDRAVVGDDLDAASTDSLGNRVGNPVEFATVQLGYLDEFPRWDKATSMDDIDRFYNLDPMEKTGKEFRVQILEAHRSSMPPDSKWVFNGIVATLQTGLRWKYDIKKLVPGYGYSEFPPNLNTFEGMLYQHITRRFVRSGIESRVNITEKKNDAGEVEINQKIYIKNYSQYFNPQSPDTGYEELVLMDDGLMSAKDANMFGVRFRVSDVLKKAPLGEPARTSGLTEKDAAAVADVPVSVQTFYSPQATLSAQVIAIKQQYQKIRWYYLRDGSLFFYHASESTADLIKDPYIAEKQVEEPVKLPAIYDMTASDTRSIRAPYCRVISPMTTVVFQSRYRISDLPGFFTMPSRAMKTYLVILCSVEFATVDDTNMMTLTCVDIPDGDAPDVDFGRNIFIPKKRLKEQIASTLTAEERKTLADKVWVKEKITIGQYPNDKPGTTRWFDIANNLLDNAKPDDWDGELPYLDRVLEDLKSWNSGLWTTEREKLDGKYSPENALFQPALSFKIPWLFKGDEVTVRKPYKKEYDNNYER